MRVRLLVAAAPGAGRQRAVVGVHLRVAAVRGDNGGDLVATGSREPRADLPPASAVDRRRPAGWVERRTELGRRGGRPRDGRLQPVPGRAGRQAQVVEELVNGLRGALLRYRVMAYTVGVGLIVLVFIGIPLRYGVGFVWVEKIVGALHGFLYIVYLVTALDLARRARFSLVQMLAMIGAGLLPFLAFFIERRVTA